MRVLQDKPEKAQAEVEKLKSELELLQQAAKQEQGEESGRYIMETNEGPESFLGAKLWPPSLEPSFADSPVRIVGMFFSDWPLGKCLEGVMQIRQEREVFYIPRPCRHANQEHITILVQEIRLLVKVCVVSWSRTPAQQKSNMRPRTVNPSLA